MYIHVCTYSYNDYKKRIDVRSVRSDLFLCTYCIISYSAPLSTKAMDNTCIWIAVVIRAVVIVAVVLTIVCYKCKNAQRRRSQDPNGYMWTPESSNRVTKPIDQKKYYGDDDPLFHEMKGVTLLRTNKGKVYRSTLTRHAEIVFIENTPNPVDITELWITNSPCSDCAQCLITHFKSCHTKPDIFIGKIYQQKKDDEGLQDLMKEGFNLNVWESFQQDPQTERKIRNYQFDLSKKRM